MASWARRATPVAVLGPMLVGTTEYTTAWLASTRVGPFTATLTSATCVGEVNVEPMLLAEFGSVCPPPATPEAVAFTVVAGIENAMFRETVAPEPMLTLPKVAWPVPALYTPLFESEMPVRPAGKLMVMATLPAVAGPLLVTLAV